MNTTLDYMDQASFLGLRALGHEPVIQWIWIYRRTADPAALRRFHSRLGRGLLGRLVETSPLPFGRHRWVRWPGSALEMLQEAVAPEQVGGWLDSQTTVGVDPEHGPGWRLIVRPLVGGGSVVVLLVSHTLADGLGSCGAVADAVAGTGSGPVYPSPRARSRWQAVRRDAAATLTCLPEAGRAAAAAFLLARSSGAASAVARPRRVARPGADRPAAVPAALLTVDADSWQRRARQLHGNSTALLAALGALIGVQLGRAAADGTVRLALPVSLRQPRDTRGNALTGITVSTDPRTAVRDLRPLRGSITAGLAGLSERDDALLAPLALTPYLPLWLARRLEAMALGPGQPVGCSQLGAIPAAVTRPAGSEADAMFVRSLEALTRGDLERLGGTARLVALQAGGTVSISVAGWHSGHVESRPALAARVASAADALRLDCRFT